MIVMKTRHFALYFILGIWTNMNQNCMNSAQQPNYPKEIEETKEMKTWVELEA